jgi:hypothetical protein
LPSRLCNPLMVFTTSCMGLFPMVQHVNITKKKVKIQIMAKILGNSLSFYKKTETKPANLMIQLFSFFPIENVFIDGLLHAGVFFHHSRLLFFCLSDLLLRLVFGKYSSYTISLELKGTLLLSSSHASMICILQWMI